MASQNVLHLRSRGWPALVPGRLRLARELRGLSREDAARELGTSPRSLARYELDERQVDSELLGKMSWLYKQSFDWFYGLEEDPRDEFERALLTNIEEFLTLPLESQKQVMDFIDYVRSRPSSLSLEELERCDRGRAERDEIRRRVFRRLRHRP